MRKAKNTQQSHISFVGNSSYQNRGCEAIVRGTLLILRNEFGPNIRLDSAIYASHECLKWQNARETDAFLRTHSLQGTGPRLSLKWWAAQANKRLGMAFEPEYWPLRSILKSVDIILEVGGDNYTLDYGLPEKFIKIDQFIQKRNVPIVLWGASVGPFDAIPDFAPVMFEHLRSLKAIFVRETASLKYLSDNGVTRNVHLVADPAFVMLTEDPTVEKLGFTLPEGCIGINLSPLVARYKLGEPTDANLLEWESECVGLITSAGKLGRPIVLVPHVESDMRQNDDFRFLEGVFRRLAGKVNVPVYLIPRELNAAEIKWVIAKCLIFAGARTHSTIAALSSCIPTLSISYSLKAKGINQDIFGNLDNCVSISGLNPDIFLDRLKVLLSKQNEIRSHLEARIPQIQARAFSAGFLLRKFCVRK